MYFNALNAKGRGYFGGSGELGGENPTVPPEPSGRWYFNSNGIGQYIVLGETFSFVGDFEINITIDSPNPIAVMGILGGDDLSRVYLHTDGRLEISKNNQVFIPNVTNQGSPYTLKIERVAGTVNAYVNNVLAGSVTFNEDLVIQYIGRPFIDGRYFSGRYYDYSDSLGNIFKIDEGFTDNAVVLNSGTGLNATILNSLISSWEK